MDAYTRVQIQTPQTPPTHIDGGMVDTFSLPLTNWEAKDSDDDLLHEVKKKFNDGYPYDNIIFQNFIFKVIDIFGRDIMIIIEVTV